MHGACACKAVRYDVLTAPLIVHCCHCTYCQRETGSAFAVNAVIEADRVTFHGVPPERVITASHSGKGQTILRCPTCHVAVSSHYAVSGPAFHFLRVGTLEHPERCPPDIHIYTSTKQPWVVLPPGARAVPEFYRPPEVWTLEAQARWKAAKAASAAQ
jgi:hypothetical protein